MYKPTTTVLIVSLFVGLGYVKTETGQQSPNSTEAKMQVVVMSLPHPGNSYYKKYIPDAVNLLVEMDMATRGLDHFIIIHDKLGLKYLQKRNFTHAKFIQVEAPSLDMWMRDYPPAMPKLQVNFTYRPRYHDQDKALLDQLDFDELAKMVKLPPLTQSKLVLEGGNIVENGKDIAITTERILKDNPGRSRSEITKELEEKLQRTIVMLADPGDTTGHSDGVVSFVEENTLMVGYFDHFHRDADYNLIVQEVHAQFPHIKIVTLHCYTPRKKVDGFWSAAGAYPNALVTYNAVYVPFFAENETMNWLAYDAFNRSTTKKVVAVRNSGSIPELGGSLRCLTWQVDKNSPVGKRLLEYVQEKEGQPRARACAMTVNFPIIFGTALVYMLLSF